MAFVEQRRHDLRRRTVDEARAGEHIEDLLALGFTQRPGGRWTGLLVARELTSDDGRSSPVTRPVLGRPAPRRPAPQAVGPPSRARSVFEVQSQQPGSFSLHVQDRVRGVQLVLQASHLRLERAHLRIQRVAFGRFRAALLRGQLPQRALAPRLRQAVRCELYNPSRRSRRPTSPGCVQRSASSRIRSRYSAVNWRRFGLATTSGSGAGLAPLARALGVSSLRSSTPRARAPISFNAIDSLSVTIGSHLHRPTVIPRATGGAGVSSMLAESGRGGTAHDGGIGPITAMAIRLRTADGELPTRPRLRGLCCKPDVGVSQIRTTTVLSSCFCVGQTVL